MSRRLRLSLFVILLGVPAVHAGEPAADFFFKKGDRIVFLGDSITEQYQYSSYIELYLTTRFPKWNLSFLNAGIGGDSAGGGANRFQPHVLAEKPTAVAINFGMNDAGYGKFNEDRNKVFVEKTAAMLEMAKKAGVRVALLSPNAVDARETKRNFKLYVETQKEFYAPLKELAAKHSATFVDQYAKTRAGLEAIAKDDPEYKKIKPYYDGFHTSPGGGLQMAHAILSGLHAPALVSNVEITLGKKKVVKNCRVPALTISPEGDISFRRIDDALPLPVQKDWLGVLPYVNELKDLNWYGLKIGLREGNYTLFIDGTEIATYSVEELAKGVNVGNVTKGPIYDQAQKVFKAINAKNQQVRQRFRGVVMKNDPGREEDLAKRLAQINVLQAEIYQMAQPVARTWELRRAK